MKKGLFTLLLLIITALPALGAPTNTSGPWGVSASAFKNLSSALASPATAGKTVVVDKIMNIGNKTTDRVIEVKKGGIISVSSGKTFTINAPFIAGLYQVFGGTGNVVGLKESYPDWWTNNNVPGITDMTNAISKALNSTIGGVVRFTSNAYAIGATTAQDGHAISISGTHNYTAMVGDGKTLIIAKSTLGRFFTMFDLNTVTNFTIKGIRFDGNGDATFNIDPNTTLPVNGYKTIRLHGCSFIDIIENYFRGDYGGSIDTRDAVSSHLKITNNYFTQTGNHGVALNYVEDSVVSHNIFTSVGLTSIIMVGANWSGGGGAVDASAGCKRVIISNNIVDGASMAFKAESHTSDGADSAEDITISDNVIKNLYPYTGLGEAQSQWYGIKANGNNIHVTGNTISSSMHGILLSTQAKNCVITGNSIVSTTGIAAAGIRADANYGGHIIANNRITNAIAQGILLSSDNTTVSNNNISYSGAEGIRTGACSNAAITNNVVFNNTGNGIYLSTLGTPSTNMLVTGNIGYDTRSGGSKTQSGDVYASAVDAPGGLIFNNMGFGNGSLNSNRVLFGPSAPASGTWQRGDIVYSTVAAPGSPMGWYYAGAGWYPLPSP